MKELSFKVSDISSSKEWAISGFQNTVQLSQLVNFRNEPNRDQEAQYLSLMSNRGVIRYEDKGSIGNKKPEDLTRCKRVCSGDLVVNSMNFKIGSFGISPFEGVVSTVYHVISPKQELLNTSYLNYWFGIDEFRSQAQNLGNGILEHRRSIREDRFGAIRIPLPLLETQQRIADYLDKETGEIDEMIENLEGLVEELKNRNVESANSVLEREEFPRKKLWQLVDFVSESDEDSNYISLDMMESWTGRLLTNDIEHSDQYIGTRFQPGDILFGKLRPYLAKSWLADREGVVVGDIHVYRPKPGISGLYLEQLFRTNTFVSFADSSSNGVKMPRVEWTRLSQYKFPAPSESVQTEIALELKDRTLEVQEMISQCSGLIEDLKARRSALITEVVSGRKEV